MGQLAALAGVHALLPSLVGHAGGDPERVC
jgi:hypothetical protein